MKVLHLRLKNQYDGYVRYWSLQHDKVVTTYCGSLFVGHCTNEYFKEFDVLLNWNEGLLLHLGMDISNVRFALQ